jgi:hypothetical protein
MSLRQVFVVVLVLAATTGLAHAALLSVTDNGFYAYTGILNGGSGSTATPVNMFDSSLGALQAVTVTCWGSDSVNFTATNLYTDGMIDATATLSGVYGLTGPGGVNATFAVAPYDSGPVSLGFNDGSGNNTYNFTHSSSQTLAQTGAVTNVDPGNFAAFIYSGASPFQDGAWANSMNFGISNSTVGRVTGDSSSYPQDWYGGPYSPQADYFRVSGQWDAMMYIQVQYDYLVPDPPAPGETPEPCTLALLGIGACGLGLRARRRKAAAA